MEYIFVILCISCIVKFGEVSSAAMKDKSGVNELRESVSKDRVDDLEGSATSAKLFNLGGLFPSYGSNPVYNPGGYPTTGGGYYPSAGSGSFYPTQGHYPTSGYYPTGTNILGPGYGRYPSQSYNPSYGYSPNGGSYNTGISGYGGSYGGYGGSSGFGGTRGYSGYSGYGGYGGNGGLQSYSGYYNPQYSGKRNLGFGYYSDTDRYGFYRPPSQPLSVHRLFN